MVLPYAVDWCSCSGWYANSEPNKKHDKVIITQVLLAIENSASPEVWLSMLKSASEFSALAPHGFMDLLHWDERDSTIIDQPLHITEVSSLHAIG